MHESKIQMRKIMSLSLVKGVRISPFQFFQSLNICLIYLQEIYGENRFQYKMNGT